MTTKTLGGLMVPAVSTFDSNGDVDAAAFRANLTTWIEQGIDGVLVAGSSGESALLDDADRRQLIAAAREVLPTDRWLLAGVGSESTRQTISRAHDAAREGADAALVVSPHYYLKRMTEAALLAHFTAVADASPIPVMLYNIPVYAHVVLSGALVQELAQHPNIIGMKDSAGNLAMLEEYIAAQSPTFRVITGSGATFIPAYQMGASGAILAVALYAGQLVRSALNSLASGDVTAATEMQAQLKQLAMDIASVYGPAGIKVAMDLVGLQGGPTRSPLLPLTADERAVIASRIEAAGLTESAGMLRA